MVRSCKISQHKVQFLLFKIMIGLLRLMCHTPIGRNLVRDYTTS